MYYHKCIILHMIINVLITMYYHKCNITMYFHKCIITVKILYESRIRWKHEYKWRCEEWIRWSLAALLKTWSEKEFEHYVGGQHPGLDDDDDDAMKTHDSAAAGGEDQPPFRSQFFAISSLCLGWDRMNSYSHPSTALTFPGPQRHWRRKEKAIKETAEAQSLVGGGGGR